MDLPHIASWDSIVDAHEKFFAGIPIVFGGTNDQLGTAWTDASTSHFMGCWKNFDPARRIVLDVALDPNLTGAVVVVEWNLALSDNDTWKQSFESVSIATKQAWTLPISPISICPLCSNVWSTYRIISIVFTLTSEGMQEELVISGTYQAGPMIADAANHGFQSIGFDLFHGEVWRYLHRFAKEGKIVGAIALVLNGERPYDFTWWRRKCLHL